MVGLELVAAGAVLLVLDAIAYARYREAQERVENKEHLERAGRMKSVLEREVVEPVRGLEPDELTRGRGDAPTSEEVELLAEILHESQQEGADGAFATASLASQSGTGEEAEGEIVFLPPSKESLPSLSPLAVPLQEAPHLETRLRTFEQFQQRSEAELSLLRENLEALHRRLEPSQGSGSHAQMAPKEKLSSLRALKGRKEKLERELQALQQRFMKRQVDAESYQRISADLQKHLTEVHAEALSLAEAAGGK